MVDVGRHMLLSSDMIGQFLMWTEKYNNSNEIGFAKTCLKKT